MLSINKADIEIQKGNFSSWLINKERRDSFELAQNEKLKKEINRLKATAKEKSRWSDTAESEKIGIDPLEVTCKAGYRAKQSARAKKIASRAKAMETRQQRVIDEKSALLKNTESSDKLKIYQSDYRASRLVTAEKLSVCYGDEAVFKDVSFEINKGDRIALQGKNGAGKSTLIKLICGESIPYTGVLETGSGLTISYVSQDTSGISGRFSSYSEKLGVEDSLFKAMLNKLNFTHLDLDRKIEELSEGEKKKVLIAGSLCERAHLHVWDEPLNFIDVISRMQIEELLLEFKPTILFVEHDRAFAEKVANKTICLK